MAFKGFKRDSLKETTIKDVLLRLSKTEANFQKAIKDTKKASENVKKATKNGFKSVQQGLGDLSV